MQLQQDGIWIIDANGNTTYANDRMAEILGTSPADMMGQHSFHFVFPENAAQAQKLFEAKLHGDTNPFEFKLRRKDNRPVWVRVQGTPMSNAAGTFLGIVGTFTVQEKSR